MRCHYEFPDGQAEDWWDSEDENSYHEAAHIAIANIYGLELLPEGILIFESASASKSLEGSAYYREGDLDDIENRKRVLVALIAGMRAQDRKFPEMAPHSSLSDEPKFCEILRRFDCKPSREAVNEECARLLGMHWPLIEATALALLQQPWRDAAEEERKSGWGRKKQLSLESILAIVRQHWAT